MKTLDVISTVLVILGGLNWGLVGLFDFDAVATIFGDPSAFLSRSIYTLIGLAALYQIFSIRSLRNRWEEIPVTEKPIELKRVA